MTKSPTETCPGYDHYFDKAAKSGSIECGITLVSPSGSYLFVPFSFAMENFKCGTLDAQESALAYLLSAASNEILKHWEKLK